MVSVPEIEQMVSEGRYREALRNFDAELPAGHREPPTMVLRAELLQRVGRSEQAKRLIRALLKSSKLDDKSRAWAYFILGRAAADEGEFEEACTYLHKSTNIALAARNYRHAAWAQARLLALLADSSGPNALDSLLTDLRHNAARSGDPQVLALTHLYIGQAEAQRTALSTARRHLSLAASLLATRPNLWIESMIEHVRTAICIMASDFPAATQHAKKALALADESGQMVQRSVACSNLGYTFYVTGHWDDAVRCYEQALEMVYPNSDHFTGALDTLANIRFEQGKLTECEDLLKRIEHVTCSDTSLTRYVYRHSMLTRVKVLTHRGDFRGALALLEKSIGVAEHSQDKWLLTSALLNKADILRRLSETETATDVIEAVGQQISTEPPELFATYQRVLACALAVKGEHQSAKIHFERAHRICFALGHSQGVADLRREWHATTAAIIESAENMPSTSSQLVGGALECIAALISYAGRWHLVGLELIRMLSDCGLTAVLVTDSANADEKTRASTASTSSTADWRINLQSEEPVLELAIPRSSDVVSGAVVNALRTIVGALKALDGARLETEQRSALWPMDELPSKHDQFVVSGHFRDLMAFAQRVARANVNVLITGESGTGKEILAHAVHDFSDRAVKPFVPFNCAAIPPHLLESQLFGYRRGAFTGADKNYEGVIRSARGGTLFLDEIGELSLDLQPKFLRFLESGEISPLGEPISSLVDVRIVAATNRNLEDSVRDGLFREDLFYRVNVVRLALKPLRERRDEIPQLVEQFVARAAKDFNKGHIDVAEETMERLLLYRWPGNVRQLSNEIRRMVALVEADSVLQPYMISNEIVSALPVVRSASGADDITVPLHGKLTPTIERIEREMIKAALQEHQGKVDEAAKALGISRKGLYLKRHRFGL